jgi:hypothetical protein
LLRRHKYHIAKGCQEDLNARFDSKHANFKKEKSIQSQRSRTRAVFQKNISLYLSVLSNLPQSDITAPGLMPHVFFRLTPPFSRVEQAANWLGSVAQDVSFVLVFIQTRIASTLTQHEHVFFPSRTRLFNLLAAKLISTNISLRQFGCVFRPKSTPIPRANRHSFRLKSALVPRQIGTPT